mgnify:CR=1 FL=1|jgi:putative transposase
MCELMKVSRSTYYHWLKHAKKPGLIQDQRIFEQIKVSYSRSKGTYGSHRITEDLKAQGIQISRASVARIMQSQGLRSRVKRKFKATTNSKHSYPVSPNILERNFYPQRLNEVWVSDITYIRAAGKWHYLTTIMDLADRMIIGWSLSLDMTAKNTVIRAWKKAIQIRKITQPLIFHSDRGVQYACNDFRNILSDNKFITQSMSRKANCWDNAVAESFFKTLKTEFIYQYKFNNYDQLYKGIFEYIEGWYNTRRKHSSLNYSSPFEKHLFLLNLLAA